MEMFSFKKKDQEPYKPFEEEGGEEEEEQKGQEGVLRYLDQGGNIPDVVGDPRQRPPIVEKIKVGVNSAIDQSRGEFSINMQQLQRGDEENQGQEGEGEGEEEQQQEEGEGEGEGEEQDQEEEQDYYGDNYGDGYDYENEYGQDDYQGEEQEEGQYEEGLEDYEQGQFEIGGQEESQEELDQEKPLKPVEKVVKTEYYKQDEKKLAAQSQHSISALDARKRQGPVAPPPEKQMFDLKVDEMTDAQAADYLNQQRKVRQAMKQRKTVRFTFYFIYLIVMLIAIVVACKFLMIRSDFVAAQYTNFNFTIDNCTLLITDKTDSSIRSPVYIKYQVPTQLLPNSPTTVTVDEESDPVTMEVLNGIDPRYCLIKMFVQPDTPLGSMTINCPHCNITQDTSTQLQVQDLAISGEVVYANFRDVKAKSFNYETVTGFIQLNNIETLAGENTITIEQQGDIIIQSVQDFRLDGESDTQAFCLSGPALKQVDVNNCQVSGENSTIDPNSTCRIVYDICSSRGCGTPATTFTVKSTTGNIYANVIPAVGMPVNVNDTSTVMGQIYDDGIGFDPESDKVISGFDTLAADQSKGNPFILFDLGNFPSRSSLSTRWVISSTPSYSLLRPWWIGTFSATILNGYVERVQGFLLPGFCPFIPVYTNEHLLAVEQLIDSKINNTLNTLVTFVQDDSMPQPPDTAIPSTGVMPLISGGDPKDKWYTVELAPSGQIVIENNNYTKKGTILATVIVSLIIAIYVSWIAMNITFVGINQTYTQLRDFANHLDSYSKLERSQKKQPVVQNQKDKKKQQKAQSDEPAMFDSWGHFMNILKNAPSPSAFIDYLTLILYRRYSSSVAQFYNLLFDVADKEPKKRRSQRLDPTKNMINGTAVKILYEKFCFMNHLTEEKLTDPENINILKSYGFEISASEDQKIEVFTRVDVKNWEPFLVNTEGQDNIDSLDLFMKENVQVTQFVEDQVDVARFIRTYSVFCDYNRLPRVMINPGLMKDKFGVDIDMVAQQVIMRIPNLADQPVLDAEPEEKSFWQKYISMSSSPETGRLYIINQEKLEKHFNLVMGVNMSVKDIQEATVDLILYPGWILWDALTVLVHLLIGGFVTLPIVCFVILNESQYEPWSLEDPLSLIRFQDIIHDPAQTIYNLYHTFSWNIALMILVTILWIISFFDLLWYYAVMDFPQDKSFKNSEKQTGGSKSWKKLNRQVEWLLVFTSLALYFGYIGLLLTWLLLGAFINPNAFLPFASAAATFITFVVAKYNSFKQLISQGTKAVMAYVEQIFGGYINDVLAKVVGSIEKAAPGLNTENLKQVVGSEGFKNITDKLGEVGVIDPNTMDEYTEKIQAFDPQNIIAIASSGGTVAPQAAVEVQKEIVAQKAASKELANIMKAKTIDKIKVESAKRKIPPSLVELMIATSSKDTTQIQALFKKIIEECHPKLGLLPDSSEVISELLFAQSLHPEEMTMFLTVESINLIFKAGNIDKVPGLSAEVVVRVLRILRYLDRQNYDAVAKEMIHLFSLEQNRDLEKLKLILPIVTCISTMASQKANTWNAEAASLELLNASNYMLGDNRDNNTKDMLKGVINFLPVLLAKKEVPTDLDSKDRESLDSYGVSKAVLNFCKALKLNLKQQSDGSGGPSNARIIPNLIHLWLGFMKQDIHDIPREVLKGIERKLEPKIYNTTDFLTFWLKIVHFSFQKSVDCHMDFNKCLSRLDSTVDFKNFIRILTCYSLKDFDRVYQSIKVEKNTYFVKLADALKVDPRELLGLIDLIYQKNNSKNINIFLRAMMTRSSLNLENTELVEALVQLFLSEDETELLHVAKILNLEDVLFLLIGKGCLDPKALSAKQFEDAGVYNKDLVDKRNNIATASEEDWLAWKSDLRQAIVETLQRTRKSFDEEIKKKQEELDKDGGKLSEREYFMKTNYISTKKEKMKRVEAKANLTRLFLSDWDSYTFSRKNVELAIKSADNKDNQLERKLIEEEGGSYDGADVIPIIMDIKHLKLHQKGRYDSFTKEQESAVTNYARYLGINADTLKKIVQMFVLNDKKLILSLFFEFFPDEKEYEQEINKILSYGFKQVNNIQKQVEFVREQFTKSISLPGQKTPLLPYKFFEKLLLNDYFKANFGLGSLFDVILMQTAKYKLDPAIQDALLTECCRFAMFMKGNLPRTVVEKDIGVKNPVVLSIFDILAEPNIDKRMASFTKLFVKRNDPIKVAIAFYGLLTNRNFNVNHADASDDMPDGESLKSYLSSTLEVASELFDMFELAYERDPAKFLTKSFPLMRRLLGSPVVNTSFMESLFMLSFGEHFNSNNLASKLGISSDNIEFFVFLVRLSKKTSRKKELNDLPQFVPVNKVLSKLKVKPTELTCLVKLIFSMFDSDESLLNIITELKLKSKDPQADRKTEVNIDIFKGFAALSKPVDQKIDVYKNKKILNNTKEKINALFEALGLNQYKNSAFMLANLAAGNFLVLREYIDDLDWYIPTHNEDAKYYVQNLTMGLSGLLNSSIEVEEDLAKYVKLSIPKYKPYDTAETMLEKPGDKDLPTNSIAYAVCLLYQTLNITPALTQAFMMDRKAFTDIQSEYPDLKPDFLWAMVLQFIDKTDTLGDVMGLYEWVGTAADFYKSKTDSDAPQCPATEFRQKIDSIDRHLSQHMDFGYRAVKLLATNRELLQTQPWKLIFSKHTRYNARVNQSLMFLLTFDVDAATKKTYAEQIQDLTRKEPYEFLDDLTRILPPDDGINHPEKEIRVGRLIRKALRKCYEVISKYHLRTQAAKEREQAAKAEAEKDQVNKSVAEKDQANKSLAGEVNKAEAGEAQASTDPDMKGLMDFALTDLCTLGTISFLRQDPSISTDRKLYNLHQVASNIERKLCFNDNYIYLSRIKLMKLLGVSLNLQVSSLNEWSFPQTLFTYDYIDGIELAQDKDSRENLKAEWCKNFVFSDGQHVCDMGALYGTFYTANQNIDQWLGCKDWDEIALFFQLDEWYLCDYSIDSIERFRAMNEYRTFYQLQDDGDENHPRVFRPLEVLRLMFDENENAKQISEGRKGYGRENINIPAEEPQVYAADEEIVDTKTGLSYKDLLSKMMDFEKVLLDPNTELVFSVIRGDVSAFLKTDHALAPNDPERKRAKSYMALTGLQSLKRKKKKQGLLLKDYLGILAGQLDSEIACLEEILTFIVDKPIVSEISSILDIDDITANFLLMNVKEGVANDEEEDQAAEEKDSITGFIRKKFPALPDRELQVFDIIRNIYLLRKQPGWMDALRLLKKDGRRYSELQKSGAAKNKKNDVPDHPLAPLFNLIDFTKLRNQATTPGEEKMIFNTIGGDINEAARMDKLFNYILDQKIYKSDGLNKETLKQQYNATMLLLRLEFREAFKTLVLTGPQKAKDTAAKSGSSSQNTLENFLELFGVNLSKNPEDRNDILYLKLFLILNQDDQRALRGADPKEIDKLISDMERLDFLRSLTTTKGPNVKKQKLEICQILFATLAWDSKLVLESFAQEDTLEEGYILYDIYTCCNLNRFRAKKSEFKWNFLGLLRSSICHFVPDGISKSILINDPTPELQEYSTQRSQRSVQDLQKKIEDLCKTLDDKKKNPAEPLAYFLLSDERVEQEKQKKSPFAEGQTDQIVVQEEVDMNKIYTGNAEYTIPNVVVSLADFTFLSRLLNTFTDQSSDQYKRLSLILKIMTDFEIPQPSDPRFGEMFDKNVLDLLGQLLQQTYEQDPQSNEPLKCLFELLPLVLLITMLFQLNIYYFAEILPILITNSIEGIKGKMPDPTQSGFISDLLTIILGTKTPITKKLDKVVFEERMRTLFNRVRGAFFPDIAETAFDNWFLKTHELAQRLESDVMPNMKDIQKRREISKNILKIFGGFKLCSHDLMDALFAMLDGDLTKFQAKFIPIAPRLGISPHSLPQMVKYLKEAQNLLTGDFFTKPSQFTPALPAPTRATANVSAEDWAAMLKKIKEGTASSKDLFNMVDAAGDSSGSISETEFSTLAGRLGLKLSPHRVKEIFAKVKGQKADASNQDLNVDEFDKALTYLQEKNLQQALLLLGITPEILTGVLIRLTILLLLLFVFIFLGIKAFAVGGTFGSIINSLFPMAGGTALGKEKEGESKLEDSSVKEATDKGFEITTSEQL